MTIIYVDYGTCTAIVRADDGSGQLRCQNVATDDRKRCRHHPRTARSTSVLEHTCGGRGETPCPACTATAAQAAYVTRWRAEHAVDVWGLPWLCPLCGKAVQDFFGLPAHDAQIEDHQQAHGADWTRYLADGIARATGDVETMDKQAERLERYADFLWQETAKRAAAEERAIAADRRADQAERERATAQDALKTAQETGRTIMSALEAVRAERDAAVAEAARLQASADRPRRAWWRIFG